MERIKFNKNGQWELVKAFDRPPEHVARYPFSVDFKNATRNTPVTMGGKLENDHHQLTNEIPQGKGKKSLYHHVYANGLGDTRHILSLHKDPNKPGVAGTLLQTDKSSTGFADGRPVSGGIRSYVSGKGYGRTLLEAAINHHGEWHSGESFSPDGRALVNSVINTGRYHVTPDTPETQEVHDKAIRENRKGDITRVTLRVRKPSQ